MDSKPAINIQYTTKPASVNVPQSILKEVGECNENIMIGLEDVMTL